MAIMSPKLGEILVKTTHSKDLDDALNKIFSEYLVLKLKTLQETITLFQKKWNMNFEEFKKHFKDATLTKDVYTFNVEKDFWEWEETETLKKHYEEIKKQWI
ncbi:MAG: hypothetical protein QY317_14055 [Candidatus Jettenia caeni]|nr:MAG: hypothetical protein QY317_14055 [Candidatus Jettenia caeni]